MRRVEHLITAIRRLTDNESNGSDSGLSDEEFIQFLNDAQDDLYAEIVKTYRKTFTASSTFSAVTNQEEYDLPTDIFQTSVVTLEYSHTGLAKDYYPLERRETIEQSSIGGAPLVYIPREKKLIVNPYPETSGGVFRIKYNKRLPTLDKRRATVKSVTIAGGVVTALTLEPTYSGFNGSHYLESDYLTAVDFNGSVKCTAIGYSSVSGVTGVVTFTGAPAKTLLTGEAVAVGDYVVLGKRASTHSQLFDDCERYLIAYSVWKALRRDESSSSNAQKEELVLMRSSIVDSYGENYQDVDQIPRINSDYPEYL